MPAILPSKRCSRSHATATRNSFPKLAHDCCTGVRQSRGSRAKRGRPSARIDGTSASTLLPHRRNARVICSEAIVHWAPTPPPTPRTLRRRGITVAERDRGELQGPTARRAPVVGDCRLAGRSAVPARSVAALLQSPADPAGGLDKMTPPAFTAMCPALPPLRLAAFVCAAAPPGMRPASALHQLSQGVDR